MKITFKKFALLAVLTLAVTSCQKEFDANPMIGNEQTTETINVVYSINGEVFRATMSESEWDAFLERMLALAREGYEVSFSKNENSLSSQKKEIVTFTTTNEDEAHAWADYMADHGYTVTISFDKKTKTFICTAIK